MTLTISLALLALFYRVGEEKKRYLPYYFFLFPLILALDVKVWGWHLEGQKAHAALLMSFASISYGISHVIDYKLGKPGQADRFLAHIAVLAFGSALHPILLLFAAFLAFISGERGKLKKNGRPGRNLSWCFPLACAGLFNVTALNNAYEVFYGPKILFLTAVFILLILPDRHSVLALWTMAAFALLEGLASTELIYCASFILIIGTVLGESGWIQEKVFGKLKGKTWFEKMRLYFELRRHSLPVDAGKVSSRKAVLAKSENVAGNLGNGNYALSERARVAHILYYGFLFIVLLFIGMWS